MLFLKSTYPNGAIPLGSSFKYRSETGHKLTAPTWDPDNPHFGDGLYGLKNGVGYANDLLWSPTKRWLVLEADYGKLVHGTGMDRGQHKMPEVTVRFAGNREGATSYLQTALAQEGVDSRQLEVHGVRRTNYESNIVSNGGAGSHLLLGDNVQSKIGRRSYLTCGDGCFIQADQQSYVTMGDNCDALMEHFVTVYGRNNTSCIAGYDSLIVMEDDCIIGAYDKSHVYTGARSNIKIRNFCKTVSGDGSTIDAGRYCDITTGEDSDVSCNMRCKVIIGARTIVSAGAGSQIIAKAGNGETVTGYVKHLGLRPFVKYRLGPANSFVEVT